MVRKYADILAVCKFLRIKVLKRLFNKAHNFDSSLTDLLSQHAQLLKNEEVISKTDLQQISKDIERISLHPILKQKEVRCHLE